MTQDSFIRSQSGRMSPAALALAIGLHALAAAGLWWAEPLRHLDHYETPIMISMEPAPLSIGNTETPAAAPPASPPAANQPAPPQAAPADAGPPDIPSPPREEVAVAPAEPMPPPQSEPAPALAPEAARPAPVETETPLPAPSETQAATTAPELPSEAETEATWQTDASAWKPQVTLEPQAEMPPRRTQVRPASRPPTAPRVAQIPGKRLEDYPPRTSSLGPSSSSSMEGATADGGARNDYLSRVYRHIGPYRDYPAAARASGQHGRVATRVTIDRAGGLINIRIAQSSGWPLLDNAELSAIRRAMPLPPLPDGIPGESAVLNLNMNY